MNDKGAAMTRYEAIEKALQKLIADYESEIHDNYDGTSFLSYRMAEVHDAKDVLGRREDSKVVNAELYKLAIALADSAARSDIECVCATAPGGGYWIRNNDADVDRAVRYLAMREASGEPMPYKVVRDGDKVRFE